MLVKGREMTVKTQTLPWWLGGEEVKTTGKKYIGPVAAQGILYRYGRMCGIFRKLVYIYGSITKRIQLFLKVKFLLNIYSFW